MSVVILSRSYNQSARVLEQEHTADGIIVEVELPASLYERYQQLRICGD